MTTARFTTLFACAVLCAVQPARADDFSDMLAYVYQHDPQLIAQREQVKSVDETVALAASGFRPSLNAEYDRGRERTSYGGPSHTGDDEVKQLRLSQPLYNGGGTVAQMAAAKARVKAERARLEAVEQRVFLAAVMAQADLVERKQVLSFSHQNSDVLGEQRDAAQSRFKGGELTQTDVAQSQARLARAGADLTQAEADEATAESQFMRATGLMPTLTDLPPLPPGLPATLPEAEQAALSNPELVEAQFREKAAGRDVDQQTSALLPSVSLQASILDTRSEPAPGVSTERQDAITVNLSIPLYQGGAEYARVREARSVYQKARYNSMDANRAVLEAVRRAWRDFQAARTVIASGEEAVRATHESLGGVQEENRSGARTVLDVLDAEQEYFAAGVSLERSRRSERVAAYQLLAAMGKLNAQTLNLPTTVYDPTEHYENVRYKPIGF